MPELLTETFDVYLVLRPFREKVHEHRAMALALAELEATFDISAEGYYSYVLDCALVALRIDRNPVFEMGRDRLQSVIVSSGLPTITPEELSFERRCEFFLEHLASYTTHVQIYDRSAGGHTDQTIVQLAVHIGSPPQSSMPPLDSRDSQSLPAVMADAPGPL